MKTVVLENYEDSAFWLIQSASLTLGWKLQAVRIDHHKTLPKTQLQSMLKQNKDVKAGHSTALLS
jgi:hypothetical protein